MKLELSKTEIRAVLVWMATGAENMEGGAYENIADRVFQKLQQTIGEEYNSDRSNWFKPLKKETPKLPWAKRL